MKLLMMPAANGQDSSRLIISVQVIAAPAAASAPRKSCLLNMLIPVTEAYALLLLMLLL